MSACKDDLKKISTFVNERDLKLFEQQAVAKYTKAEYEKFCKENEILVVKIESIKEKIRKAEEELPKVKELKERMMDFIAVNSDVTYHLVQRKLDVQDSLCMWKEKYEKLLDYYSTKYLEQKTKLEKNNPLHRELEKLQIKVKKMEIQAKIIDQKNKDMRNVITQKGEINRSIRNVTIVNFVKAVTNLKKLDSLNKEIAEKKVIAQQLREAYEKQNQHERQIKHPIFKQTMELPKSSLNVNVKTIELPKSLLNVRTNMIDVLMGPTSRLEWKDMKYSSIESHSQGNPIREFDENALLNQLKERSEQRTKIILERQYSNSTVLKDSGASMMEYEKQKMNCSKENISILQNIQLNNINDVPKTLLKEKSGRPKTKQIPLKDSNTSIMENEKQKMNRNKQNISILQNIQLNNINDVPKTLLKEKSGRPETKQILKRPSDTLKKAKRVSFREISPQSTPMINTKNFLSNPQNNDNATKEVLYFSNPGNNTFKAENNFPFPPASMERQNVLSASFNFNEGNNTSALMDETSINYKDASVDNMFERSAELENQTDTFYNFSQFAPEQNSGSDGGMFTSLF